MAKKKKNKNKSVNIYQPEAIRAISRPGSYQRPNNTPQTFTAKKQRELQAQKSSKRDQLYRQIGTYSTGAVQDAARRAGINANATKESEAKKILDQLRNPSYRSSINTPSRPAPASALARATPPPGPTTPYSSQIDTMASNLMAQQQDFDQSYGQPQVDFQNMMIQFRNEANERALASEKRFEDMMIAQQQAEARAAAEREEAARQAAVSQRTMIANQMRAASAAPQLKFGSTETGTGTYGTRPFKRRTDSSTSVAKGIANRMRSMVGGINV